MSAKLRVLTYHRIGDPGDRPDLDPGLVSATAPAFERQMRHLARHYEVVGLERAVAALRGEAELPRRAVLLTFDDAYRDFGEVAWPVLRRLGLPATLFVPTGYPDRPDRSFWWDRLHRSFSAASAERIRIALGRGPITAPREAPGRAFGRLRTRLKELPHEEAMAEVDRLCRELGEEPPSESEVLGWDELRELEDDGVTIGSHARSHALLTRIDRREARCEVAGARRDLDRELGRPPAAFCYPAGHHDETVVQLVREAGYETAFTTVAGHNRPGGDPFRLRRTVITRRTSLPILALRLQGWFGPLDRWRKREERARTVESARPVSRRVG